MTSSASDSDATVKRFEADGMAKVAALYARGPTRVQFIDKDPEGWQEFHDRLAAGSAEGHALTMRGVQMKRPSIYELEAELERLRCRPSSSPGTRTTRASSPACS